MQAEEKTKKNKTNSRSPSSVPCLQKTTFEAQTNYKPIKSSLEILKQEKTVFSFPWHNYTEAILKTNQ